MKCQYLSTNPLGLNKLKIFYHDIIIISKKYLKFNLNNIKVSCQKSNQKIYFKQNLTYKFQPTFYIIINQKQSLYFLNSLILIIKIQEKLPLASISLIQMWKMKTSYRSFDNYELDRILDNKRNLAQVESVLTLYERNNRDLIDQVQDLIRENMNLRKQKRREQPNVNKRTNKPYGGDVKKSHVNQQENQQQSFVPVKNMSKVSMKSTKQQPSPQHSTVKHSKQYHPRNAYLTPHQIQNLNIRKFKQAKIASTSYDHSREYQKFKQKLSEKKQQLKKSYKRNNSNMQASSSQMTMSRHVYLQEPSLETVQKRALQQKHQDLNSQQKQKYEMTKNTSAKERRDTSPYDNYKKETFYESPLKQTNRAGYDNRQSAARSSSAIKIEDVYAQNSVRIQQPHTKWKDLLSETYFSKSKQGVSAYYPSKNTDRMYKSTNQWQKSIPKSNNYQQSTAINKNRKKKFLNVTSNIAESSKSRTKQ